MRRQGRWTAGMGISLLLAAVLGGVGCTAAPRARLNVAAPTASVPALEATSAAAVPMTPTAEPTATASVGAASVVTSSAVTFAVIGDYGTDDTHEAAVAKLVRSWKPAFIVASGDDYYRQAGGSGTGRYDESTGAYFRAWLKDIRTTGKRAPKGTASVNAFFPAPGNHDYTDALPAPGSYLTYFTLPGAGLVNSSGNERYYDVVRGPVHLFIINSNEQEPDGVTARSKQARWLRQALGTSTSAWNVVVDHHPPYSSDSKHGSTKYMRWPYARWGTDVVISGHAHDYERVERDRIVYFVNGLGGAKRYSFGEPVDGSAKRYRATWGAQKVTATPTSIRFDFYGIDGKRKDTRTITQAAP